MHDIRRGWGIGAGLLLAMGACGSGGGGGESGQGADSVALGYYTYSDASRGLTHLALLPDHRFVLVHEPPATASPGDAPAPAPGSGSAGAVGWYLTRADSIFLNSERMYARGSTGPEVLRLVFVTPPVPGIGGEEYPLTFQRQSGDAQPAQGQGGGGGGSGGGGGGGGGGQGGGGEGS